MSRNSIWKTWKPTIIIFTILVLISLYYNKKEPKQTVPSSYLASNSVNPIKIDEVSDLSSEIFDGTLLPTDPKVLEYLLARHLIPPSKEPYNFKSIMNGDMGVGKPIEILSLEALKYKKGGFFIECGANDGEFLTNTFGLESKLNWTGLLIEGSPTYFQKLKKSTRKAWLANVCLSGKIEKMEFIKSNLTDFGWRAGNGKIKPGQYNKHQDLRFFREQDYSSEGTVECFPLQSILIAINVTTVDFFSLDVEGHEYHILKGIPFKEIDIRLLVVEHFFSSRR